MKPTQFIFLFLFTCLLSACFEVNEEIAINRNGSGQLSVSTDMGKLLELMQSFMPASDTPQTQLQKVTDTLIRMKDFIDTAQNISANTREALRNGTMHVQMNFADKKLKMDLAFPFKNQAMLAEIIENMDKAEVMGKVMKGMAPADMAPKQQGPEMKQISSFYDLVAVKGSLSRKLNKERYASIDSDTSMLQMKQMASMGGMMGDIKMNTSIKLPNAAKTVTGAKAQLSADKLTVLIQNSLQDFYDHPENFEFTIQY